MPRRCPVCAHPERDAIDTGMIALQPLRPLASRYGFLRRDVLLHHDEHLPAALLETARAAELSQRAREVAERLLATPRVTLPADKRQLTAHEASEALRLAHRGQIIVCYRGDLAAAYESFDREPSEARDFRMFGLVIVLLNLEAAGKARIQAGEENGELVYEAVKL